MLTAANAVLTLSQPTLFTTPQQLQGFAADDVTGMEQAKILDHVMGVDGFLSFGFVYVERMQDITLQGDSVSNAVFDKIMLQQNAAQTAYPLSMVIKLPAINLMFSCTNGGLETYNPMPGVRRIIQPRRYRIVWERVAPIPTTV